MQSIVLRVVTLLVTVAKVILSINSKTSAERVKTIKPFNILSNSGPLVTAQVKAGANLVN